MVFLDILFYGGLNYNVPLRFIYLTMGFVVSGTVWKELGGVAFLEEVCHWDEFRDFKTPSHFQLDFSVSCLWIRITFDHESKKKLSNIDIQCYTFIVNEVNDNLFHRKTCYDTKFTSFSNMEIVLK